MKEINVDDICYPKNFIKEVIFRVDFAPILSLGKECDPDLHNSLRSHFPNTKVQPYHHYQAHLDPTESKTTTEEFNQYLFNSEDDNIKLNISRSWIILEVFDFSGFDTFKDIVAEVVSKFYDVYKPIKINRLGLRYINEIVFKDGNPLDWEGYIKSDLITHLSSDLIKGTKPARLLSQIIYNNDDFNTTFTYGINNMDYPNPISRKEFIIDIDNYSTSVEYPNIIESMTKFNTNSVTIFENSIDVKLRRILNS